MNVFPAKWENENIKYPGVTISRDNSRMLAENINPLIYFGRKCQTWENCKLSWLVRTTAIKMILLPKLLFVFLNVILDISQALLNKFQTIINNFVWMNKKPRIWLARLEKSLVTGGLVIPKYNKILPFGFVGSIY